MNQNFKENQDVTWQVHKAYSEKIMRKLINDGKDYSYSVSWSQYSYTYE